MTGGDDSDERESAGGGAGEKPARTEPVRVLPLGKDTVRMATLPGPGDTVRDAEAPADVKALFARIGAGERVERTVLVEQLEKMLGLVRSTATAFEEVIVLVRRRSALAPEEGLRAAHARAVHTLPDGSALVHTTWTVADREELFRVLAREAPAWLSEHEDERGVPSLRSSQLDIARAASSYEDALYLLGEDVTFVRA